MKIGANELKVGNIIEHNNALWKVGKLSHTQPGKGGAYVQAELKNISNQSKLNERFRSSESIERVRSEQIEHQFLFESVILTFTGGFIGIVSGVLFSYLVFLLMKFLNFEWDFIVKISSVLAGVLISISIGIIFGVYPAKQAAKLNPIDALRYE